MRAHACGVVWVAMCVGQCCWMGWGRAHHTALRPRIASLPTCRLLVACPGLACPAQGVGKDELAARLAARRAELVGELDREQVRQ